jgi:flagellar protein FliO/FliZ
LLNATSTLPAGDLGGAWMTMVGSLLLILAFLFAGFYILRRFGHKAGLGMMTRGDMVMESQMGLGPRRSIVVVRHQNKRMVLGVTEHNINLLSEEYLVGDEADGDSSEPGFADTMKRVKE